MHSRLTGIDIFERNWGKFFLNDNLKKKFGAFFENVF